MKFFGVLFFLLLCFSCADDTTNIPLFNPPEHALEIRFFSGDSNTIYFDQHVDTIYYSFIKNGVTIDSGQLVDQFIYKSSEQVDSLFVNAHINARFKFIDRDGIESYRATAKDTGFVSDDKGVLWEVYPKRTTFKEHKIYNQIAGVVTDSIDSVYVAYQYFSSDKSQLLDSLTFAGKFIGDSVTLKPDKALFQNNVFPGQYTLRVLGINLDRKDTLINKSIDMVRIEPDTITRTYLK